MTTTKEHEMRTTTADKGELLQAIARAYCSTKNAHKEVDTELALAIADEILTLNRRPTNEGQDGLVDGLAPILQKISDMNPAYPDVDQALDPEDFESSQERNEHYRKLHSSETGDTARAGLALLAKYKEQP